MLFAAVSPVYDTVMELRTLGGYIETFILMLTLLLSAFRPDTTLARRSIQQRTGIALGRYRLVIGLGLWVDPLIATAIVTAALWIIGYCISQIARRKNWRGMKRLLLAVAAIPGFLLAHPPPFIGAYATNGPT